MQRIEIKNQNVLDILDEFRYTYFEKYSVSNICQRTGNPAAREYYVSDKYRDEVISMGTNHEGFADFGYAYMIKPSHLKLDVEGYREDWIRLDEKLKTELGLQSSALSLVYPPGGYIEWHNNANAAAHNLIFTYSETGDGQFVYYDRKTKQNVVLKDKKGWSLKAGYFGDYLSDKLVYHCAETDCWRMTISYVLGHDTTYWKDCLDYISEE